jgi:hypothetical protein
MKKWAKKVVAAALVLLTVIGAAIWSSREPTYKGKGVQAYLNSCAHFQQPPVGRSSTMWFITTDEEAFRFFGTKSMPHVRNALRARETWGHKSLCWIAGKAPWLRMHVRDISEVHLTALVAYLSILQGDSWSNAGAACETDVRALTSDPNPVIRMFAGNVLAAIHEKRTVGQFP